ncbi:Transcription factor Jun [Fusarium oxysporum f. sp. vasinfectum]|nr:Transcription factor Jun [Fusarium oxysporum f. sp. vasinfectum]
MEVGVESTYIALSTQPAEFKNLGGCETLQNILPPVMEDKMLNRRVHTRRQLQVNEALYESSASGQTAESPKPKKRGRKPKKQSEEHKDPRRRRVLERNRIAANKCRLRKRDEALALASREETMEDQNRYLMTSLDSLTVEVYHLKTQLLRHTECNCVLIQHYIANEAQKCVDRLVACSTAFDTYGNSLNPCDGSPSGASTAEELNTQSLNGGRFLSTPRISSQQESGTSGVTGVMFDMRCLGPFQTATMPSDSIVFTQPVPPLSFIEYGPGLSIYEGPREHQTDKVA